MAPRLLLPLERAQEMHGRAVLKKKMMNMDPCMGVTPRPSWEAPWVANIIFGRGCKRGFHSSTFYFSLHFSEDSLTNFSEDAPGTMTRTEHHLPSGAPVAVIVILG